MGNRYDRSITSNSEPRLNSLDASGGGQEQGAGNPPVAAFTAALVTATAAAPAGLAMMHPFISRQIKSSAYLKRHELIARQSSRKNGESDWTEAETTAFGVEWYDNQLDWIETIHQTCGEAILWDVIAASPPSFRRGEPGPKEKLAAQNLADFKPTRMQKLLKQDIIIKQELENQVAVARDLDQQDYQEWKRLSDFARDILDGNRTAYLRVLEEMAPLEDLIILGSGLEFSASHAAAVEVELDVNSEQVIPREVRKLTDGGSVEVTLMDVSDRNELERKYICGSVLKIACEMFALLPLERVLVHARDTKINSLTGQEEYVTVLSIQFERGVLTAVDLQQEACLQLLDHFPHHIQFDPASGFKPVEKLSGL